MLLTLLWALLAYAISPYEVLGLKEGASPKEVRSAWAKLANQFHPDRAPPGKELEFKDKIQKINAAYNSLKNNKSSIPPRPGPAAKPESTASSGSSKATTLDRQLENYVSKNVDSRFMNVIRSNPEIHAAFLNSFSKIKSIETEQFFLIHLNYFVGESYPLRAITGKILAESFKNMERVFSLDDLGEYAEKLASAKTEDDAKQLASIFVGTYSCSSFFQKFFRK